MKESTREIVKNALKSIPIESRIRVTVMTHFLIKNGGGLFMPLDENGNDLPEAVELNNKCLKEAEPLIKELLDDIEKWKADGCPESKNL